MGLLVAARFVLGCSVISQTMTAMSGSGFVLCEKQE
jgi:hypothetical protein